MSEILLEIQDGVALITLNAPDRRNAFVPEMVAELLEVCDRVDDDQAVGAVVICGNGPSFCSGAHRNVLSEAGRDPARSDNFARLGETYQAFVRVGELKAPTIAAVRGHAVGAGVNLMLASDLRIVSESRRIMTGFMRIGLHASGGHFSLLGRLARRGRAWVAFPEAEAEPREIDMAKKAAADPELARAAVRSMRIELGPPGIPWPAALEVEKAVQMWSLRRRPPEAGS